MKGRYKYDLEVFKNNILINTERYGDGAFPMPEEVDLIWDAKENIIMPISEYVKKKKVDERKNKIKKIKDKL